MDHEHMHNMSPPPSSSSNGSMTMMHMTFFWGKNTEVLFAGWPGKSSGMYVLCLIFIFFLSVLTEWLSHSPLLRGTTTEKDSVSTRHHVSTGLVQTAVYTLRTGLSYLVMLAVMSFNTGVFIAALGGHGVGFMLFGSRIFKKEFNDRKPNNDLLKSACPC
ncbi:unnamed protein product [Cochlearia groenlandica]